MGSGKWEVGNRPRWPHAGHGDVGDGPLLLHYRVNAGATPATSWIQDPEIGGGRSLAKERVEAHAHGVSAVSLEGNGSSSSGGKV